MKRLKRRFATAGLSGGLALTALLTMGAATAAAATVPPRVVAPVTVTPTVVEPPDRCADGIGGGMRALPMCVVA